MKNNVKESGAVRPRGKSEKERWYALARKWCSVIANRQKTRTMCENCFDMRTYSNKHGWVEAPNRACDGCAEMERFHDEAKNFFEGFNAKGK